MIGKGIGSPLRNGRSATAELAIHFRCYKETGLCANRLRLLLHYNPDSRIYVLFGAEAQRFDTKFLPHINDFYVYPKKKSPQWKCPKRKMEAQ
jgi:hypothetical protein